MLFIANRSSKVGQSEDMNIISTSRHFKSREIGGGYISSFKMYFAHFEGGKNNNDRYYILQIVKIGMKYLLFV